MAERQFQSGLGTEWERVYKEGSKVSTLILAQVIKVNYKYNSVDLMTLGQKDTFQGSHTNGGKFSAKLPMEFGGRNSLGQPFGQVKPINVGDHVLVGFINQSKQSPVVLGVYTTPSINDELSRAPFDNADYRDDTLTRQTNQTFSLYPSLTYDNIDGEGNKTVTFTGKTFFVTSAMDNQNSALTDGNHGTEYDELETSYYGNGEEIEPMNPYAPNMLLKHQGLLKQTGGADNHLTLFHIKDDGTYRVSTMDKADDWRTYFEMAPDGSVKLRKQFDSKVIGKALKRSEIGIEADGTVFFRNGDTYLEVKSDGIYSNGLNIEVDLTEIQETLDEQGKKIVIMSTSIEQTEQKVAIVADKTEYMEGQINDFHGELVIMANEISSKVSEAQVRDLVNEEMEGMVEDIDKVKKENDRLNQLMEDISDDGLVTASEKNTLLREWIVIQDEYPTYIIQADEYSIDKTAYTKAYNSLNAYLTPIFANMEETTAIDPTEFRRKFKDYYDERLTLLVAILGHLKALAVEAMKKASEASLDASNAWREATQAKIDADKANDLIADIASDGKLTPSEKSELKRTYDGIVKEYPTTLAQGTKYAVDTSDYTAKYNNVVNFVNTNRLFTNMGETVAVNGEELRAVFSDYYASRVLLLKKVTDKAKDITDEHEGRIYVAETQIKQTSDYIALLATKVETIDNTVETHTAELKVHNEQIASKVTATQVAQQIKDTEIGMTNMLRNSGLVLDETYWRTWGASTGATKTRIAVEGLANLAYGFEVVKPNTAGEWGYGQDNINVLSNSEYTISFWAKAKTGTAKVTIQKGNGTTDGYDSTTKEVGLKWTRVEYTWTTSATAEKTNYYLGLKTGNSGSVLIAGMKFETGSKATSWAPSPLDNKAEIQEEINKFPIGGTNYVAFSSGNNMYPRLMIKNVGYYNVSGANNSFDGETVKITPTTAGAQGIYDMGTATVATANVGLPNYGLTAMQAGDYLTFSADIKATGGNAHAVIYLLNAGVWKEYRSDVIRPADGNKRAVAYAPITNDTTGVLCRILGVAGFTQVNFAKAQLETGMKSTAWKKSNFDLENDINNAVTTSGDAIKQEVSLVDIKTRLADSLLIYPDPNFEKGLNGLKVYNNSSTANPVMTREPFATGHTQPSGKPRLLLSVKAGLATSPNLGGVFFGNMSRANAEFVYEINASIPVGYSLEFASNGVGTGSTMKWLTDNTGKGTWATYYYYVKCGNAGTFASTGFFSLKGVAPTTGNTVNWYISYMTAYDLNQSDKSETNVQLNGKEGSIMKQPSAPSNPATGLIWVDTSGVPNVAKRWSGTAWVKMSPTEAGEIGAFSDSDGRDLIDRMSSAEQVITAESITNTVLSSEDFSSLFDSKANSEDLLDLATTEQLANQYSSFEALLEQQLGQAYSTLYDRQSELEQLVNSFDFKIQQAGGINMLRNSLGFSGLDFWGDTNDNGRNYFKNNTNIGVKSNVTGLKRNDVNGFDFAGAQATPRALRINQVINSNGYWTVSGYIRGSQNLAVGLWLDICDLGQTKITAKNDNTWTYFSVTANVTNYTAGTFHFVDFDNIDSWAYYFIKDFKVEKGQVATPWSPAPEDGGSTTSALTTTTQDNALANLGFGSGFVHKAGGVRLIQNITMPAKGQYTMSFFMKKSTSSGTHGGAGIELFSNGSRIAFIGAEEGIAVNEYTKYSYTFDTIPLDISVQMVAWGNINTTVTMSGLIMNIGSLALTWQPFPSEIYNTNVLIDINGITVKNNQTNGYTLITPSEFSGYAQVGSEMRRIFTLNGKTTEVEEILVRTKIRMGSISVLAVNSAKNVGWAFIGQ